MTTDERLQELHEELQKGRIVEARIRAFGEHVEGLHEPGSNFIYIDPRTAVVSTLIHELIHRRWPSWSETRVRREERRLIASMTPEELAGWFRRYQKAKRTRKRIKDADEI